jgi:hypothetical protein
MRDEPIHPVHPDLEGIEPADAEAAEKKVRLRRWKRRLKAAASLVIASAAGTFLACTRGDKNRPPPAPNPTTNEISNLPAPPRAARDAGSDGTGRDAGADRGKAMIVAPKHETAPKTGVDKREHRKGMPVPDNLLE